MQRSAGANDQGLGRSMAGQTGLLSAYFSEEVMLYKCMRCVMVYDAEFDDDRFLCPNCRDRVWPFSGPRPEHVSETEMVLPQEPILPLPQVSPISYEFTRLTNENFAFWESYVYLMRFVATNLLSSEVSYGYQQAVKGFLDALSCFKRTPTSEVWVAYAVFGSTVGVTQAEHFVRIEMCMTVTTHPDIPISTHMGIFRSPLRMVTVPALKKIRRLEHGGVSVRQLMEVMEKNGNLARPVRKLSVMLHAFAAERCLQKSSGVKKVFMITAPLKKMLQILRENCGTYATEDIYSEETGGVLAVQVGASPWHKYFNFVVTNIHQYPWLTELADLKGGRPKIAIELKSLEDAFESTRVELILDWLEKWQS
ncbi:hypothetical protein IB260_26625 [Pseudomonas sp. PDM23]|uniref:hypothetical protein n=1 Tax=unclassified Pseudomonas TaxID=196821 RepID=UPI00177D1A63|nr:MULTISPECIES: hypothetical protein [unclassified Pseudomonas]MBD9578921.1 hypothetical protein [Pseudomonas sp. PDM23]MBD9674559.1 hypothetical protein [Pseudomonas sp. PDM21]